MDSKQLFEQSARKILSANQLECVMKLHSSLFDGGRTEEVADAVATAVNDAVEDAVDCVAEEQVLDDVSNANSIAISPEDKYELTALLAAMSDDERLEFANNLDDTQTTILTEGLGSLAKSLFKTIAKKGRISRLNKFGKLAEKDAALTSKLDKIMTANPGNLSKSNAKKLGKLYKKRDKIERKMNDMTFKAANRSGNEFEEMTASGINKGSRNFSRETLEGAKKSRLAMKEAELEKADNKYKENLHKLMSDADLPKSEFDAKYRKLTDAYARQRGKISLKYDGQIDEIDANIRMGMREGRFGSGYPRNNPGLYREYTGRYENPFGTGRQYYGNPGERYFDPYSRRAYDWYRRGANPEAWNFLVNRIPVVGTINRVRIGSWKLFKKALKLGAFGGVAYGGYKLYDYFANPEEIDEDIGDGDGSTMATVGKVLAVLGGGAAGSFGAKFLGFDGAMGRTVGALLGATLVAYFMFLNGGDEQKATEMLDAYNTADEKDQEAINEALNIEGLAEALQQIHDERQARL